MVQRIRELSLDTINKIAAGEVVERPASVIKELLENSIDAISTRIDISLLDAGKKMISIKDNGAGIHPDDIELALRRHATSKIQNSDDLFQINTLGFRGEALPAIASVSRLTVTSKHMDAEHGLCVYSEFGDIKSKEKKAVAQGTSIKVEDLYSNTPARLKFMKSSSTELGHCISTVNNYASAYPGISFTLEHNGKTILNYNRTEGFEERIANVYGSDAKWLGKKSSYEYISGEIYIKDPGKTSDKNEFKTFINGRAVRDRMCVHALSSSFEKHLSTGTPPSSVLFLNIEPAFIDVNVSPTKNEVRFREPNLIYNFIQTIVEQALNIVPAKRVSTGIPRSPMNNFNETPVRTAGLFSSEADPYRPIPHSQDGVNIIGQFQKQYLLIEEDNNLVMIDQHAAHERINFERIFKALSQPKESQSLLIPELIEFSLEDAQRFRDKLKDLASMGFDIEEFSSDDNPNPAFVVRSVPKAIEGLDLIQALRSTVMDKEEIKESLVTRLAKTAARMSCHDSIRGTRSLSSMEAMTLLDDLKKCDYPHVCPHGRPTKISLSLDEIEKMFKRK